jgi:hypothetical protein
MSFSPEKLAPDEADNFCKEQPGTNDPDPDHLPPTPICALFVVNWEGCT